MQCELSVLIDDAFASLIDAERLEQAALAALEAAGLSEPLELSIVVADDDTVRRLNRTYRGVDEATDVLAFALEGAGEGFVVPPDGIRHLGEVIIAYSQAQRQATELGHAVEVELAVLTIHGVLHLLGYDHEEEKVAEAMRSREEEALRRLRGRWHLSTNLLPPIPESLGFFESSSLLGQVTPPLACGFPLPAGGEGKKG